MRIAVDGDDSGLNSSHPSSYDPSTSYFPSVLLAAVSLWIRPGAEASLSLLIVNVKSINTLFFILISKSGNLSSPRVNSYQQWNCYCSLGTSESCCCCGTETITQESSRFQYHLHPPCVQTHPPPSHNPSGAPAPRTRLQHRCKMKTGSSPILLTPGHIGDPSNGEGYWCGEKVEWIWRRVGGGLLGVDGHTPNQQRRMATDSRGVFSAVGGHRSSLFSVDTNGQDVATGAQIEHPFNTHTTTDAPKLICPILKHTLSLFNSPSLSRTEHIQVNLRLGSGTDGREAPSTPHRSVQPRQCCCFYCCP